MNQDAAGPYAQAAWAYRQAGWAGVLPIGGQPARKSPPPTGYTGYTGIDPSGADIQAWIDGPEGARNIGLRLNEDIYVLDVDAHSGKPAEASLAELAAVCGPLPATWTSTARSGASRQHFLRAELPEGRVWRDHPGEGLDSLHLGHRYAIVWPSIHPTGALYQWFDPTGELWEGVPSASEFAVMPDTWIEALSRVGEPLAGSAAGERPTLAAIRGFRGGAACRPVETALAGELARIAAAGDGGALHDPGRLYTLVAYGLEGHTGVAAALSRHQSDYVAARARLRAESTTSAAGDWWRQVRGAVGKRLAAGGLPNGPCDCADPFAGLIAPTSPAAPGAPAMTHPEGVSPASGESGAPPGRLDQFRALLLDTDGLDRIPPLKPLIDGVLYRDKLAWLFGPPKSFKSFLALDLAGAVATGTDWQGYRTGIAAPVLYLVAEGAAGIRARVRAWETHNGRAMRGVRFLPIAVQTINAADWRAFIALAVELEPALIVLDTQARITAGVEENSAKEMGEVIYRLDALRVATGACVLPVHHTGRNGEHLRGSIAIDGAADTAIRITRDEKRATVTCEMQKDVEEFEPFITRVLPVAESIVLARDPHNAPGITAPPGWAHEWWRHFRDDPVSISLLIETQIVTKRTFYNLIYAMIDMGLVEKVRNGRSVAYQLLQDPSASGVPNHDGTPLALRDSSQNGQNHTGSGLCDVCLLTLDAFLIATGETTHPGCAP